MRKQQIKQFLDLVKTLETACGELKRQRADKFLDLCAEIQEFVSCMFDYAETVFGEDTRLSNLIRELYELLFNIAQGNAHVKLVSKKAFEIKSEAANLKADKIEVVFFCYKASMSDSLESIYFAAKADPACDAYFIAVPYFDRNPDGSFGQMHVEGEGGCALLGERSWL